MWQYPILGNVVGEKIKIFKISISIQKTHILEPRNYTSMYLPQEVYMYVPGY